MVRNKFIYTDKTGIFFDVIAIILILAGMTLTNLYSYLLFHTLAELFSIVIAGCIFVIVWNSRTIISNNYLLIVGIAYLFIGGIDLLHTLTYSGMGIVKGYQANLPTQLWLGARIMEGMSLLCASFFLDRTLNPYKIIAFYAAITAFLLLSIFQFKIVPVCFVEGVGLTWFKKASEYVICLVMMLSLVVLVTKKKQFEHNIYHLIVGGITTTIFSELAFTFYVHVYSLSNLIGHLFKVISFYLLYKAIIETSFKKPFSLLLRDLYGREMELKESEDRFRAAIRNYPGVFVIYDSQRRIQYINSHGLSISGHLQKDIIGYRDEDINPPEVTKEYLPLLKQSFESKTTQSAQCLIKVPSGEFTFVVTYVPILDRKNALKMVLGISHDITEQVNLVKERDRMISENIQQRQFLEKMMKTIPIGVATVRGKDHRFEYVNPYYQAIPGTSGLEMVGKTMAEVFPDLAAKGVLGLFDDVYQTGKPVSVREFPASLGPDRENTFWDVDHIPLTENDQVQGILIIAYEVTENVLNRQKLEQMIASQKAILENLNEGLVIIDPKGHVIDMNQTGLALLGFENIEALMQHRSELFNLFELKNMQGEIISSHDWPTTRVLNKEAFTDYELFLHHLSSNKKWVCSFSGAPVYNDSEEFILAVLVLRDITQQKQAEHELKQSHQNLEKKTQNQALELENERKRFYFVLENLPAFVCLHAQDCSLPYVNRYFKRQFGKPEGKFCYNIMRRKEDLCKNCNTYKVLETNKSYEWTWVNAPDNRVYHVYDYPFVDSDGSQMVLEMGVDITKRIDAENKLKKYSRELEVSNKELEDFAYVTSHDLQEPLRKIQTFGNRIRMKYGDVLDDRGQDYLMRMENAAKRMRNLIMALLQYSRISTQAVPFEPVDLNVLIKDVIGDIDDKIRVKNIIMEIDDLMTIEADYNQIRQLFQNLIGNAIKFNDKPDPWIRIQGRKLDYRTPPVGSFPGTLWYQIVIEDNGIGFEEEYADRIFMPFQRLHSPQKFEGTGIGLSICRKVVDRHGGTITAKSIVNQGTSFIVTLPVKHANA